MPCDFAAETAPQNSPSFPTRVIEMDHIPYDRSWELMRNLVPVKAGNDSDDLLILTESEPVFTLGRRATEADILVPEALLESQGMKVRRVERGGLVTYHGPGQLLAYPVFNVNRMGLSPSRLVHGLEGAILAVLDSFGVQAERIEGRPGVWVGRQKKIASIGVAVRRGISFHGLALNVNPNLGHFGLINPCGFTDISMTSMALILGRDVPMTDVRAAMREELASRFNLAVTPWTLEEAEAWAVEETA